MTRLAAATASGYVQSMQNQEPSPASPDKPWLPFRLVYLCFGAEFRDSGDFYLFCRILRSIALKKWAGRWAMDFIQCAPASWALCGGFWLQAM